jgi:hypothetical protein
MPFSALSLVVLRRRVLGASFCCKVGVLRLRRSFANREAPSSLSMTRGLSLD